jgi:hypothetical protein
MTIQFFILLLFFPGFLTFSQETAFAQSNVNGDQYASPNASVSTNTTGGTNINYQTNNAYNNEYGFAPGIFCRTPTLFVGGGVGTVNSYTKDDPFNTQYEYAYSHNWQQNANVNAQIGFVYPFGSSVIEDCKTLVKQITIDRRISTELSIIRTCSALEKEGLIIDPNKFPLLAICIKQNLTQPSQVKMPVTTRS